MKFEALRARVHEAEVSLAIATEAHDQTKARHREALVNGTEPDRAGLLAANERIMEARDQYDIAVLELESEQQAAIGKAASAHVRALDARINKTLNCYPLEDA
jgi:hypothetical protein